MSETVAEIIVGVAVALLVLPGAASQMSRQAKLAKRRGWLDAATPGAVLPSKRSLIIGLSLSAVWLVVSIPAALLTGG